MRRMIIVGIPSLIRDNEMTTISFPIENEYDGTFSDLRYTFESKYEYGLSNDRADGVLISILRWLAFNDFSVTLKYPISERLYYQITEYLLPAWKVNIKIYCQTTNIRYEPGKYVATGMSCGIDSMATYYLHCSSSKLLENNIVNMLTFFDIAAFSFQDGYTLSFDKRSNRFDDALINSKKFADTVGLPLFVVRSNLTDIFQGDQSIFYTFQTLSIPVLFQKMFRIYYYSSSCQLKDICFADICVGDNKTIPGKHDIFYLMMLSTNTLTFYHSVVMLNRVEKTALISSNEICSQYLHVCQISSHNCTVLCDKCIRTITTLDAIGVMEKFTKVFDLSLYKRKRIYCLGNIISKRRTNLYCKEIYLFLKSTKKVPIRSFLWAFIDRPLRYIFKKMNRSTKDRIKHWFVRM